VSLEDIYFLSPKILSSHLACWCNLMAATSKDMPQYWQSVRGS